MIFVGMPAFERITEDGHLAGSCLEGKQQPCRQCQLDEGFQRGFLLFKAVDMPPVGTYKQSTIADGQTISLARNLCRPLLLPIGRVVGHNDSIAAYVEGVSSHRKTDWMLAMDFPFEEVG